MSALTGAAWAISAEEIDRRYPDDTDHPPIPHHAGTKLELTKISSSTPLPLSVYRFQHFART